MIARYRGAAKLQLRYLEFTLYHDRRYALCERFAGVELQHLIGYFVVAGCIVNRPGKGTQGP